MLCTGRNPIVAQPRSVPSGLAGLNLNVLIAVKRQNIVDWPPRRHGRHLVHDGRFADADQQLRRSRPSGQAPISRTCVPCYTVDRPTCQDEQLWVCC